MLKIKEAVIVEGKYDKIKLSNLIDTLIIETNGFAVFKDKKKLAFIRKLANERGIIVITDSDHSGFQIRNYISSSLPKDKIKHIYIPDIYGKEKRKKEPSKEGKLGVEGIDDKILLSLFEKANIEARSVEKRDLITSVDMFTLGLSGTPNATQNKKKLLKSLDLPEFLSTSSLISYLNSSMDKKEFYSLCHNLFSNQQ
ncbi:MAG: DUF4093 domain-containing protein [Eubacteriales bacterium]|jgi:ribonuclease M5|nr:DUF4093 domain-containing protein [Eubacteriales bacterium]